MNNIKHVFPSAAEIEGGKQKKLRERKTKNSLETLLWFSFVLLHEQASLFSQKPLTCCCCFGLYVKAESYDFLFRPKTKSW